MKVRAPRSPLGLLGLLWRWSWLVTVPIAWFFVHWLVTFAPTFGAFRLRYDVRPHPFGWATDGADHARHLARTLSLSLRGKGHHDGVPVIDLVVPAASLAALDGNLPHSGFTDVDGELDHGGGRWPVEVRYRGDFHLHWAYPKKSLRVRLKKQRELDSLRTFHLIAPKATTQINDVLACRLAGHLRVLAPRAELVQVQINGRPRGLHVLLQQIDEDLLAAHGRPPGDVYTGELIAKDAWQGITNHVFDHPGLWPKAAADPNRPADDHEPLRRLCALLSHPPGPATQAALEQLLDLDAFARFAALTTLLQSVHHDESHNWRLYFDPLRARFEPILWDANAWGNFDPERPSTPSLDPEVSRLLVALMGNSRFLQARQAALRTFFADGTADAFLAETAALAALASDAARLDAFLRPPDHALVARVLGELPAFVGGVFQAVRKAFVEDAAPVLWHQGADQVRWLQVADRLPIQRLRLRLPAGTTTSPTTELAIGVPGTDGVAWNVVPTSVREGGTEIVVEPGLMAQLRPFPRVEHGYLRIFSREVLPTAYGVRYRGGGALHPPIDDVAVDRGDGVWRPLASGTFDAEPVLLLAHRPPAPTTRWSGQIDVRETLRVEDLTLAPGTTVRLAPGASLIVSGRLDARGNAEAPIRIVAAEPGAPWGALALLGPGIQGSRLHHCHVEGGAGGQGQRGMLSFPAMVSVHGGQDVELAGCTFRTAGAPAAVRIAAAAARLDGCRFEGGGIGLELMHATVEGQDLAAQGQPTGLLVTAGTTVLSGGTLSEHRQGLQVSGDARLLWVGGALARCGKGAIAGNGAHLVLAQATITGCAVPLAATAGRRRSGDLLAYRCRIPEHGEALRLESGARLRLWDSFVVPPPPAGIPHEHGDAKHPEAGQGPPLPLPALPWNSLQKAAARAWAAAPEGRRGR